MDESLTPPEAKPTMEPSEVMLGAKETKQLEAGEVKTHEEASAASQSAMRTSPELSSLGSTHSLVTRMSPLSDSPKKTLPSSGPPIHGEEASKSRRQPSPKPDQRNFDGAARSAERSGSPDVIMCSPRRGGRRQFCVMKADERSPLTPPFEHKLMVKIQAANATGRDGGIESPVLNSPTSHQGSIFLERSPSLLSEDNMLSVASRPVDIPTLLGRSDIVGSPHSTSQPIAIPLSCSPADDYGGFTPDSVGTGSFKSQESVTSKSSRKPRKQKSNEVGSKSSFSPSIMGSKQITSSSSSSKSVKAPSWLGSFARPNPSKLPPRTRGISTGSSAVGSYPRINLVMEACSILPSLASDFSIDNLPSQSFGDLEWNVMQDLAHLDSLDDQKATSYQDHLDTVDMLDNPAYVDTIQSTDSSSSMLRRSLSVPPRYPSGRQSKHYRDLKQIFEDFLPSSGQAEESSKEEWRETMQDLMEHPDYIDSLQSTSSRAGLLARSVKEYSALKGRGFQPITEVEEYHGEVESKRKYLKNLIILSVAFFFVFTAYLSLRNLLSSLYSKDGLGVMALSTVYGSLLMGSIFASTIVQRLRPKCTMLMCMSAILVYLLTNFYPRYYTLLPACCLVGFSLANLWTAHATYLSNIAARYAILSGDTISNVLIKFNGTFFACFQVSQILGSIISSVVLMPSQAEMSSVALYNASGKGSLNTTAMYYSSSVSNSSYYSPDDATASMFRMPRDTGLDEFPPFPDVPLCGAGYCHASHEANDTVDSHQPSRFIINILIGIYSLCIVVGIAILWIFLDRLDGVMKRSQASLKQQLVSVFQFFLQRKAVCLLGLAFYTLLQSSFMFGEFTKAFVTCSTGVYMVGYTMLSMSVCSAISSFINSRMQRYTGRLPLMLTAMFLHLCLLSFLSFWTPTSDQYYILFLVAGLWGLADGVFLTQTISIFGTLFTEKKESAFAALKMCQALGATVLFAVSEYLCSWHKMVIVSTTLILAAAGYITLEIMLRREALAKKEENIATKYGPTPV